MTKWGTLVLTLYFCGNVEVWLFNKLGMEIKISVLVQYNGGLLPDILLLAPGYYYTVPLGNPIKYHVLALYVQYY